MPFPGLDFGCELLHIGAAIRAQFAAKLAVIPKH
jgi:hypothetical protein